MAAKSSAEKATVPPVETQGNVDKIREILFGGQMKDYDGRFNRMEERLAQESARLTNELESRLSTVEGFMKGELQRLGDKLQTERKERLAALKQIEQGLNRAEQDFAERVESLGETIQADLTSSRREFHDAVSQLQNRLRGVQETVEQSIQQTESRLTADKVSHTALSGLFAEMGMRLSGELDLPQAE